VFVALAICHAAEVGNSVPVELAKLVHFEIDILALGVAKTVHSQIDFAAGLSKIGHLVVDAGLAKSVHRKTGNPVVAVVIHARFGNPVGFAKVAHSEIDKYLAADVP
jgi:hypothetical protein